jgi:tripartite-type tricarboxylate transporter receptor subunit TctC
MTTLTRRTAMLSVVIATAGLAAPAAAQDAAATYPNKPVTIIVPFPPGGTTDVTARQIAAALTKSLGQTFIVENKAGANGNIGSAQVARSAPDGYTLLMSGVGSNAVNHGLYSNMPYDSKKDFAHVTLATTGPNVLIVNPEFPAKTLKELVDLVKANPGKYNYASAGNGASGHMAMELLKSMTGMKIDHVPYKGGAPALQDVMAGVVPMMFTNQDLAFAQTKAGKVRLIGVADLTRNPAMPDAPTIAEQGYPGFAAVSWNAISAPAGTPKPIVDKLQKHIKEALHAPEMKDKLLANGFVPQGIPAEEFTKFVSDEVDKWTKVAKESGAKVD